MEIAISLAIVGFALVAIIATLPLGLNTQRDVREQTIINQDATVLLNAIRTGASGTDDLTNYVYAVVNTGTGGANPVGYYNPALAGQMNFNPGLVYPGVTFNPTLTNGASIIGVLSTPEFTDANGNPDAAGSVSNHVVACVRSISGLAAEKPPQDNAIMIGDTFSYRVYCVNWQNPAFGGNLYELRLTFLWPQLPNGSLPSNPNHQTFRASIAGQLVPVQPGPVYFYQPQTFP